ncbi:MAG: glycosyl hydrolase family 32, partial [Acidobacteria bacterium]|nr:glycosyl hydrolase family 32 [Acidobacteriota bacterium]
MLASSKPVKGDSTIAPIHWQAVKDLGSFAGKAVRFRFHLRNGALYSFWVSGDENGASRGYVAAGGPGYASNVDVEGLAAYPKP